MTTQPTKPAARRKVFRVRNVFLLAAGVAYLLRRDLVVGAEYRMKPDNLGIAAEDDAWDVFVAWAPTRHTSLTVAYVDLGNIVVAEQRGWYASLQVGF